MVAPAEVGVFAQAFGRVGKSGTGCRRPVVRRAREVKVGEVKVGEVKVA